MVTASEVFAGGGFGSGAGTDHSGSGRGAGDASHGRPIAAIVISEDGVVVRPIVDASKIATAVVAWVSIALMAMRLRRNAKGKAP